MITSVSQPIYKSQHPQDHAAKFNQCNFLLFYPKVTICRGNFSPLERDLRGWEWEKVTALNPQTISNKPKILTFHLHVHFDFGLTLNLVLNLLFSF